ncbi:MAG: pyridoxal phosphate-dependent aminotransferase [Clostridia bacterium]|nr:pyridoxal phosphate-dependent aminotransferase [Clostridia bacterium]
MISQRMLSIGKSPSKIREIFEYSRKRKAQIGEDKVFDFSLGNPNIPAPKKVNEVITDLIKTTDSTALHGYTSAVGDMDTRKTIADNIKKRFCFECSADNIYMTCGAAASLEITLKAICNRGDEVIALAPYFPEYKVFIENAEATTVEVLCREGDMGLDIEAIKGALNGKTKAIIVNSPNNPSGAVFAEKDIKKLAEILNEHNKKTGETVYIICDEPYREIVYGDIVVPYIPSIYDHTIVCYSYSKSLSLPGERIGYIMVSPKARDSEDIYFAVCGAGRVSGYVCAPSLMQYVVNKCDGLLPDIEKYAKNRDLIYNSLKEIGFEAVRPDGAFYLFVKALESDAVKFCETAKKYELLLVPSDSFGIKGYVRIAYCVSYEQIKNSIPQFKKLFEDYKNR